MVIYILKAGVFVCFLLLFFLLLLLLWYVIVHKVLYMGDYELRWEQVNLGMWVGRSEGPSSPPLPGSFHLCGLEQGIWPCSPANPVSLSAK